MSKQGYVYYGPVKDADQVAARLQDWFAKDETVYLASFRSDDRRLDRLNLDKAEVWVAEWDAGCVFSARCEVRWCREGEGYAVWLLVEEGNLPADLGGLSLIDVGPGGWQAAEHTAFRQSVYLWGQYKQQEKGWVEVRLPKLLVYPVDEARKVEDPFVRVGHIDYRAPNGAVQFVRLTEVQ